MPDALYTLYPPLSHEALNTSPWKGEACGLIGTDEALMDAAWYEATHNPVSEAEADRINGVYSDALAKDLFHA